MKFMAEEWLRAAHYDLLAIESMKENTLLTTIVAFHAQQCIEKSLLAYDIFSQVQAIDVVTTLS